MSKNMETKGEPILALAKKHGIELKPLSVKINESGLDFLAVFARSTDGASWVIRVPRRPDVVESAAYEKKVLDLIIDRLPVAVPNWQVHTPELIAYRLLDGLPMGTINHETMSYDWYLDPQSIPEQFVQSLAEAMVALHTIDHSAARNAGIRVQQPEEVRRALAVKMDEIKRVFGVSRALWERWKSWLADDACWPNHSVLVHGDLHPGHILVDPDGTVTGLLDWTEAEVADPATDFTAYCLIFGESGLAELLERYEKAGGSVWPRMQEHIIERMSASPVLLADFAWKSGLEEYMTMARNALGVDEKGEEISTK